MTNMGNLKLWTTDPPTDWPTGDYLLNGKFAGAHVGPKSWSETSPPKCVMVGEERYFHLMKQLQVSGYPCIFHSNLLPPPLTPPHWLLQSPLHLLLLLQLHSPCLIALCLSPPDFPGSPQDFSPPGSNPQLLWSGRWSVEWSVLTRSPTWWRAGEHRRRRGWISPPPLPLSSPPSPSLPPPHPWFFDWPHSLVVAGWLFSQSFSRSSSSPSHDRPWVQNHYFSFSFFTFPACKATAIFISFLFSAILNSMSTDGVLKEAKWWLDEKAGRW